MGKEIQRIQCPVCAEQGRDTSQNGLAVYEDGAYCYKCGYNESRYGQFFKLAEGYRAIESRGLSVEDCEKYNIKLGYYTGKLGNGDERKLYDKEPVVIFNIEHQGKLIAQKVRSLINKHACVQVGGTHTKLFGMDRVGTPTTKIPIIITEGEFDAVAANKMSGCPAVTGGGATELYKKLAANLEWLLQWQHVILCFDQDEAGQAATLKCLDLFEPDQVKVAKMPLKDANDMLMQGKVETFKKCIWNAEINRPKSLVKMDEVLDKILDLPQMGAAWPWKHLNDWTFGIKLHEIYGLVAGAGVGKTEFVKELVFHMLSTNTKCGIFSFEESIEKTSQKLLSTEMKKQLINPHENSLTPAEKKKLEKLVHKYSENTIFYDNSSGFEWDQIKRCIKIAVKCDGARFIIIDNLTVLASHRRREGRTYSEAEMISFLVNEFLMLSATLPVTFLLVVHPNKNTIKQSQSLPSLGPSVQSVLNMDLGDREALFNLPGTKWENGRIPSLDDVKGTDTLANLAAFVLSLSRDRTNSDLDVRSKLRVKILKTRDDDKYCGSSFFLKYNYHTGRLEEQE